MLSFSYSISVSPHLNYTSKDHYYLTSIDKKNEDTEANTLAAINTIKHMFPTSMTSSSIQLSKQET